MISKRLASTITIALAACLAPSLQRTEVTFDNVFDMQDIFTCKDISNGRSPDLLVAEDKCENYVPGTSPSNFNCDWTYCERGPTPVGRRGITCRIQTLGIFMGLSTQVCEMLECEKNPHIAACKYCQCGESIVTPNNQGVEEINCKDCLSGATWWPCNKGFCGWGGRPVRMDRGRPLRKFRKAYLVAHSEEEGRAFAFVKAFLDAENTSQKDPGCYPESFQFYQSDQAISALANIKEFIEESSEGNVLSVLAFLAHTKHESGEFCFHRELGATATAPDYCSPSETNCSELGVDCTCKTGVNYYGRGPLMLSYNYNYAQFSADVFGDEAKLLEEPGLLETKPALGWLSGVWFWFMPQYRKPSAHFVMNGTWTNSNDIDLQAGREPGFGMTTNIINGGGECGAGGNERAEQRAANYERLLSEICLDVSDDRPKTCENMAPYGEEGPWSVDEYEYTNRYARPSPGS